MDGGASSVGAGSVGGGPLHRRVDVSASGSPLAIAAGGSTNAKMRSADAGRPSAPPALASSSSTARPLLHGPSGLRTATAVDDDMFAPPSETADAALSLAAASASAATAALPLTANAVASGVAAKVADTNLSLTDNWDDHEGYYSTCERRAERAGKRTGAGAR